jgi:hypothetical protein
MASCPSLDEHHWDWPKSLIPGISDKRFFLAKVTLKLYTVKRINKSSTYLERQDIMHARVTIAQRNRPEMTDEPINIFHESMMPEQRQQQGYKGTLLLVDRAQGKGIVINLYETEAHSKAAEQSGHDQKQIGKFAHLITSSVVQEVYEVPVYDIEMGRATTHTRVTFAQVQPDKMDEGIKIFRDAALPQQKQQPGYKGTLLLVDRPTGKAMVVSLWQTELR